MEADPHSGVCSADQLTQLTHRRRASPSRVIWSIRRARIVCSAAPNRIRTLQSDAGETDGHDLAVGRCHSPAQRYTTAGRHHHVATVTRTRWDGYSRTTAAARSQQPAASGGRVEHEAWAGDASASAMPLLPAILGSWSSLPLAAAGCCLLLLAARGWHVQPTGVRFCSGASKRPRLDLQN